MSLFQTPYYPYQGLVGGYSSLTQRLSAIMSQFYSIASLYPQIGSGPGTSKSIFQRRRARFSAALFQNSFEFRIVIRSEQRFTLIILGCFMRFRSVTLPFDSYAAKTNQKSSGF